MKTPIADFVKKYAESDFSRFHMPGHKGESFLGCEKYDITEIAGADVLSSANGIIYESEKNAASLFKTAHTFYTTGGSTAAICAMLALVNGEKPLILAVRNVHKAFIHACALLDYDIDWLMPEKFTSILNCKISAQTVEKKILSAARKPAAVYLTSPDYLGNIQNIPEIAAVCKKYDIPLLVDNAHGSYLGFLKESLHPIHLGATACCDSAHKTLPVLTGGAYLHIAKDAPDGFLKDTRRKLALFTSTSPSYLILQSLDLCNAYIADGFEEKLEKCIEKVDKIKELATGRGFKILKSEPLKIVVDAYESGYLGGEIYSYFRANKIEPEFYDEHYVVLMVSPLNSDRDYKRLSSAFENLSHGILLEKKKLSLPLPQMKMSIRHAVFADSEVVNTEDAVGRICAAPTVSCPPAVPIAISGEEITEEIAKLFLHYGIDKIQVVKE